MFRLYLTISSYSFYDVIPILGSYCRGIMCWGENLSIQKYGFFFSNELTFSKFKLI